LSGVPVLRKTKNSIVSRLKAQTIIILNFLIFRFCILLFYHLREGGREGAEKEGRDSGWERESKRDRREVNNSRFDLPYFTNFGIERLQWHTNV
jgi:hypothetical protein